MFNEFKLNDKVTLRNKLVMAPMTLVRLMMI